MQNITDFPTGNVILTPMLEKGASKTSFEPYDASVTGDNTINITGKNLFNLNRNNGSANGFNLVVNEDKTVTITGGSSTVTYFNLHNGQLPIKPNTTYTISGAVSSSAVLRIRIFDENGTSVYSQFLNNKLTFTTPSNGVKYDLYIVLYASQTSVTYKPQLELGDTATTYEPYIGKSYPINLGSTKLKTGDSIQGTKNKWNIVRADGTIEPIADTTLISQLNNLRYNAESYEGTTNISQVNSDMPFIFTASAIKDLSNL